MVDYINYNGKKLPIKIAFSALNSFEKETGILMKDIKDDLKNYEIILWYGLKAGHRIAKEELEIEREEVECILDECLGEIQKIFIKSMIKIKDDLVGGVEEASKKKK